MEGGEWVVQETHSITKVMEHRFPQLNHHHRQYVQYEILRKLSKFYLSTLFFMIYLF